MFELAPAPVYDLDRLTAAADAMREETAPATVEQPGHWGGPSPQPSSGDNDQIPAGYTYFGQFVDHDVTFDATSRLGISADPDALTTFRSPRFDLDSLYGSGPTDEPFQYSHRSDEPPGMLLLDERGIDLPRNQPENIALIGDPRNDENTFVSQLQVAFIKLHNKVLRELGSNGPEAFDEARRRVRWHYQWVVVNDFLKRICGAALVDSLLERDPTSNALVFQLGYYPRPRRRPYVPVEFSAAAYRYGHSQVRVGYQLNESVARPTFLPGDEVADADDFRGQKRLPDGWQIEWSRFVNTGSGTQLQPSRLIDLKLSPPMFDLPRLPGSEPQSLALRNLLRGQDLGLPAGQDVARRLGTTPLTAGDLGVELEPTPLWLYVLGEAAHSGEQGRRLGPVGARIVAETLLGLLASDPNSYVQAEPGWTPTIAGSSGVDGTFGLPDLINFATAAG